MVREDEFVPKPSDLVVLHLRGKVDHTQVEKIKERIDESHRNGIRHIVFDFKEVDSVDRSSIQDLDSSVKAWLVSNHLVSASNVKPELKEDLAQADFTAMIDFYDSEEEALSQRNRREGSLLNKTKHGE